MPEQRPPPYTPETLRALRTNELRLSQQELADRLGYSRASIQRYESGDSPIPVEFLQNIELLRAKLREERAQEAEPFIPLRPGMQLIRMLPAYPIPEMPEVYIAVPIEPPAPDEKKAQDEQTSSDSKPGTPTRNLSRTVADFVRRLVARQPLSPVSFALSACLVLAFVPTGCLRHARPGSDPEGPYPRAAPGFWNADGAGPVAEPQRKPIQPYKGQKQAPCNEQSGELEVDKLCWYVLDPTRPCPSWMEKHEGKCLAPVPEAPRRPSAQRPESGQKSEP